jgi:hypothetical protein
MLEGTTLSEGRGGTTPRSSNSAHQGGCAGDHEEMEILPRDGLMAPPARMVQTFHKHAGNACGVQIH